MPDGKVQVNDRWLSVQEVAGHLGVSRETIYAWIKGKRMPAHRIGRHPRAPPKSAGLLALSVLGILASGVRCIFFRSHVGRRL